MNVAVLSMLLLGCAMSVCAMDDWSQSSMSPTLPSTYQLGTGSETNTTSYGSDGSNSSNSPFLKSLQTSNQKSQKLDPIQMILTGEEYLLGPHKNYSLARKCFEGAVAQQEDKVAHAWGSYYMGTMIVNGLLTQDNKIAYAYLRDAVTEFDALPVKSKAVLSLAELYFKGGLASAPSECDKFFNVARRCYKRVIKYPPDSEGLAFAWLRLGMFCEDGYGDHDDGSGKDQKNRRHDKRDYASAILYYKSAANMDFDIEAVSVAKISLADMAFAGNGMPKNYTLAFSYCNEVIAHSPYPACVAKALLRRAVLYEVAQQFKLAQEDLKIVAEQKCDLVSAALAAHELRKLPNC